MGYNTQIKRVRLPGDLTFSNFSRGAISALGHSVTRCAQLPNACYVSQDAGLYVKDPSRNFIGPY
jgi:hypothetical protein